MVRAENPAEIEVYMSKQGWFVPEMPGAARMRINNEPVGVGSVKGESDEAKSPQIQNWNCLIGKHEERKPFKDKASTDIQRYYDQKFGLIM